MIYEFKCENCNETFSESLEIFSRNKPLNEPCPKCGNQGSVFRVFSSSITYDTVDVQTRARRANSDFADVMKSIKKTAGKGNTINV